MSPLHSPLHDWTTVQSATQTFARAPHQHTSTAMEFDVVTFHVVSMLSRREDRETLGYTYERCVQCRIPPCQLSRQIYESEFISHLTFITRRDARSKGLKIYNKQEQCLVLATFRPDVGLLTFIVRCNMRLRPRHFSASIDAWHAKKGDIVRCYFIDVERGVLESSTETTSQEFCRPVRYEACRESWSDKEGSKEGSRGKIWMINKTLDA